MTETDASDSGVDSPATKVDRLGQRAAAAGMHSLPHPDVPAYVSAGSEPRLRAVYPALRRTHAYF